MAIRQRGETTQIAVLEDNVLVEHYVALESQTSIIGNVYLGRVQNVLPSMEAAFIDIGKGRNAVLYAGEVNWDLIGDSNAPRRIENALKPGQSVLVQVSKDPIGHKGARLTSQINLPGRYLVYVPGGGTSGISPQAPRHRAQPAQDRAQGHPPRRRRRDHPHGRRGRERGRADPRRHAADRSLGRHREEDQERPGAGAAVRRARHHAEGRPRPVHRGLRQARHLRRRRLGHGRRLRPARRARPRRAAGALPAATATCSPTSASTSRSARRSTARSGCRPAARWSSTAPRR